MKKLYLFLWGGRTILCCAEEKDVLQRQAWDFGDPAAPRIVEVPLQDSEVGAIATGFEADDEKLHQALDSVASAIERVTTPEQRQVMEIFRKESYTRLRLS